MGHRQQRQTEREIECKCVRACVWIKTKDDPVAVGPKKKGNLWMDYRELCNGYHWVNTQYIL